MTTASLFDDEPIVVTPLAMTLRPYQQEAVDGLYDWFNRKTGNPLIEVPTGGGKSLIIAGFVHSVYEQFPRERILVLTHVKELIAQNHAQLLRCWPGAPAGIYSASLRKRQADAPILFAGIQSVFRKPEAIGWADIVIVDECHLIPREGDGMYRSLLRTLQAINEKVKLIGFTATAYRTGSGRLTDGKDALFDGVAYSCDLRQLIADGYLSPITAKATAAAINTAGVHMRGGEFVAGELEDAARADGKVAAAVSEIIARGADRKSWLLFCCGVKHAQDVANALEQRGIACAQVYGSTRVEERDAAVAAYRNGEVRALVNVNVLTTGFDAPQTDLIALLRPTGSAGLYVQMVGRGLRLAPGKRDCLVLDFGNNVRRHGPIDQIKPRRSRKQGGDDDDVASGVAPVKECPQCASLILAATTVCPDCQFEFPPAPPAHEERPSEDEIISAPVGPMQLKRWVVKRMTITRHEKEGKTPSMRVDYTGGWQERISEWVCFEHHGYARNRAIAWWRERGGKMPVPATVEEARVRIELGETAAPYSVTVDDRGEFPQLKTVRMTPPAGADPDDMKEADYDAEQPAPTTWTNTDDIPF